MHSCGQQEVESSWCSVALLFLFTVLLNLGPISEELLLKKKVMLEVQGLLGGETTTLLIQLHKAEERSACGVTAGQMQDKLMKGAFRQWRPLWLRAFAGTFLHLNKFICMFGRVLISLSVAASYSGLMTKHWASWGRDPLMSWRYPSGYTRDFYSDISSYSFVLYSVYA